MASESVLSDTVASGADPFTMVTATQADNQRYIRYEYRFWAIDTMPNTTVYTGSQLAELQAQGLINDSTAVFDDQTSYAYTGILPGVATSAALNDASGSPPPSPPPAPPAPSGARQAARVYASARRPGGTSSSSIAEALAHRLVSRATNAGIRRQPTQGLRDQHEASPTCPTQQRASHAQLILDYCRYARDVCGLGNRHWTTTAASATASA
jgi:hypothetical protein